MSHCQDCNGNIIEFTNPLSNYCLQCGRPVIKITPYKIRNIHDRIKKIKPVKPCVNCRRSKKKIVAHGLCQGCYETANRMGKFGTPEFKKGLKIAKARYANPDYLGKRGTYIRKGMAA